jgi:Dirigent-like protein
LKRKCLVLATLAAAVSAAVVAAVAFAAGGSKAPNGVTIRLIEKSQSFHYVDNPPLNESRQMIASQGDMFVLTSNLRTTAGKPAGQLRAYCVVTNGGKRPSAVCTGTFGLAGGQLAGETTIHLFGNAPTHIAIVGGTGAYEGARGSVLSVSKNQNISIDTIHLLK